jgi:glucoamylase
MDGWKTTNTVESRALGSAGFSVDIATEAEGGAGQISFTLHWPESNRWLGYNENVEIVS